jgi:hypothetical protein
MVKQIFDYIRNLATDIVDELYEYEYENMPAMKEKFKPKLKVKKDKK